MDKDGPVTSASFSPDSKNLATASTSEKGVKIWSLEDTIEPSKTLHTDEPVTSISYSLDGKSITAADYSNQVYVWDMNGKKSLLPPADTPASSINFSPDSKTIAAARYNAILDIFPLNKTAPRQFNELVGGVDSVEDIAFSPKGQAIALAYKEQIVTVLNLSNFQNAFSRLLNQPKESIFLFAQSSKDPSSINQENANITRQVSFSPDGKILASADDRSIVLWDFDLSNLLKLADSFYSSYSINTKKNHTPRACN